MDGFGLAVVVVLLIEIPWSMRSAWRTSRRYRARVRDSQVFRFLTAAALWIAFVGGGAIGAAVLYLLGRTLSVVPDTQGVVPVLLAVATVALLAFPIALERLLGKIARQVDNEDIQEV